MPDTLFATGSASLVGQAVPDNLNARVLRVPPMLTTTFRHSGPCLATSARNCIPMLDIRNIHFVQFPLSREGLAEIRRQIA